MRKDQLLLYIRGERSIGKSSVIHALEMEFTLLERKSELMFATPIGCAAEGIRGNTVYTILSINTYKAKSLYTNGSRIWIHQSLFIIDELSIIHLWLLAIMDKQLCKVQHAIVSSTALFGGQLLVILMSDYYQFASVSSCTLWDLLCSNKKIHKKVLWGNIQSVLSLTEQMQQRSNLAFHVILKHTRRSLLNLEDVNIPNA